MIVTVRKAGRRVEWWSMVGSEGKNKVLLEEVDVGKAYLYPFAAYAIQRWNGGKPHL